MYIVHCINQQRNFFAKPDKFTFSNFRDYQYVRVAHCCLHRRTLIVLWCKSIKIPNDFHCKIWHFVHNQTNPYCGFMQNQTNPLCRATRLTMKNRKTRQIQIWCKPKISFSQNQVKWNCQVLQKTSLTAEIKIKSGCATASIVAYIHQACIQSLIFT